MSSDAPTNYGPGLVTKNIDYMKKSKVDFFYPVYGIQKRQDFKHIKGSFIYEPLFSEEEVEHLILRNKNKKIVEELIETFSFDHFSQLQLCHSWYLANKVIGNFHYERILDSYDKLELTDKCCPIIKLIKPGWFNNTDLLNSVENVFYYARVKGIEDHKIIINSHTIPEHKALGNLMDETMNVIANITYLRFGNFLKEQRPLEKGQETDSEYLKFTNNFDSMKTQDIYEYFKENLVGEDEKYTTESKLNEFLINAFELKRPLKEKIVLKTHKKKDIHAIFYGYWVKTGYKYGDGRKYASLCENYFKGFKSVYPNFNTGLYKKKIQ